MMQKKNLAVAVVAALAFPAVAAADSSVTLSGTLQTQVVAYSGDFGMDSNVQMNDAGGVVLRGDNAGPNRITLDVAHDLGGGLTALARYNTDFNVANAGQELDQRDSYVGLSGDFGTITAGRQDTPYNTAGRDPLNATFLQGRMNGVRAMPANGWGNGGFLNNVIKYENQWGMTEFSGALLLDPVDDSDTGVSARLGFDLGTTEVYGAFTYADDHSQFNTPSPNRARLFKLGVDWSNGPWRLMAEIENGDSEMTDGTTVDDNTVVFVSGTYSLGDIDLVLNLGHNRSHSDDVNSGENLNHAAFAAKYHFSNQVMAYAGVGYVDDKGFDDGDGDDGHALGAGMRVSF
ncbi:putative porin [Thioalkalivibrio sp. ALE21]|uniref:porin n=1 Tax=Thioalkalivibrio sp. ALE21 TaxID=1158175 RepID=UPI000D9C10B3|nr:porin [Thioalkalivibrio sp. ALE21]PYG02525.1 putative porin [Thioalkalivibrio sp. ALE21]